LDLGFVGLILFLVASAVALHRAIRHLRVDPSMEALWPPVLLTFVLLTNLMESLLLKYNSIDWLLYVATLLSIASITRVPAPDHA
jgi:O-antigen ligase